MAKFRWRVLAGTHNMATNWIKGPDGITPIPDPNNPGGEEYKKGDIIDTDLDLGGIFDKTAFPGNHKFELVTGVQAHTTREELMKQRAAIDQHLEQLDKVPVPGEEHLKAAGIDPDSTLNAMTVDELRKFAAGEEIDLGNAKTKAEIVAKIKTAQLAVV